MVGPTVSLDSMAKGKLLSLPVDQPAPARSISYATLPHIRYLTRIRSL